MIKLEKIENIEANNCNKKKYILLYNASINNLNNTIEKYNLHLGFLKINIINRNKESNIYNMQDVTNSIQDVNYYKNKIKEMIDYIQRLEVKINTI